MPVVKADKVSNPRMKCQFCDFNMLTDQRYEHYSAKHFFDFWTEENEELLRKTIKIYNKNGVNYSPLLLKVGNSKEPVFFCAMNHKIYSKASMYDKHFFGVKAEEYEREAISLLSKMRNRPVKKVGSDIKITPIQALIYELYLEINHLREDNAILEKTVTSLTQSKKNLAEEFERVSLRCKSIFEDNDIYAGNIFDYKIPSADDIDEEVDDYKNDIVPFENYDLESETHNYKKINDIPIHMNDLKNAFNAKQIKPKPESKDEQKVEQSPLTQEPRNILETKPESKPEPKPESKPEPIIEENDSDSCCSDTEDMSIDSIKIEEIKTIDIPKESPLTPETNDTKQVTLLPPVSIPMSSKPSPQPVYKTIQPSVPEQQQILPPIQSLLQTPPQKPLKQIKKVIHRDTSYVSQSIHLYSTPIIV